MMSAIAACRGVLTVAETYSPGADEMSSQTEEAHDDAGDVGQLDPRPPDRDEHDGEGGEAMTSAMITAARLPWA